MSKRARFKGQRFAARMLVLTTVFLLALLGNALTASAAPTTILSANPSAPNGDAGWYKTVPSIYLWAMGENTTYSPSAVTYYSWDTTGSWQVYSGPIVAAQGVHNLFYYSEDTSGVEPVMSATFKVDITAATNPTASSPSHTVGGSSVDNTIDMNFAGAADAISGVDGFSIQWTQATTTTPDTIKDAEENVASTTSPALAAGSWYFHLRTKDNAGNWSAPIHSGPYTITAPDATPPVTTLTSTRITATLTSNEPGTTYFKWDAGAWQVYAGPIAILKGTHTLYYYSVDLAGNVEATKSKVLKR